MPSRRLNSAKQILQKLTRIEKLLAKEGSEEDQILNKEQKQLGEIARLEKLEEEIKKDVTPHPLTRITYHDVTKGLVGAFFGIVGHFAFYYGSHIAETLSVLRATLLLIISLLLLIIFLYFSGFRRVAHYNRYLPIRVAVIYATAMIVAIGVLFLFGVLHLPIEWAALYRNVAAVSILAVMGAATADLIGGE
jgi:uncharacterized membrane protein